MRRAPYYHYAPFEKHHYLCGGVQDGAWCFEVTLHGRPVGFHAVQSAFGEAGRKVALASLVTRLSAATTSSAIAATAPARCRFRCAAPTASSDARASAAAVASVASIPGTIMAGSAVRRERGEMRGRQMLDWTASDL